MPSQQEVKQLQQLQKNRNLSQAERIMLANAAKQMQLMDKQIQTLEKNTSATALKRNPTVKQLIADEVKAKTDPLNQQLRALKIEMGSEARLKTNQKVQSLLQKERDKLNQQHQLELQKFQPLTAENSLLKDKLAALATTPINQNEFNQFLTQSIQELQHSFNQASEGAESEIIIRDVDIEAKVITEMKNNRPVYVVPSRTDMKELGSENFQRIKYSLSIVPKDSD